MRLYLGKTGNPQLEEVIKLAQKNREHIQMLKHLGITVMHDEWELKGQKLQALKF